MSHIASTLGEVDSALCAEDGGVKFGGMRHAAIRESLAENDIIPRAFTSSVTP